MKKLLSIFLGLLMGFSVFAVSASAATYTESESNDTYSTADAFSLNSTMKGNMSASSDVDFYKITTSSTGELALNFNHTYVDNSKVYWNVYIYYYTEGQLKELSNKTVYGTSNESVAFPVVGTVSSGTYYVKVTTYYSATSNYSYSISNAFSSTSYYEKELNNSYATATSMSLNKEYGAYMNSSGDSDFYKITTSSNGKLSIRFNHTYVDNSRVYWNVYIYRYADGGYSELSYRTIYGTSNESVSFPIVGAVSSGVYYVKVTTYYGDTTVHEYSISNSFTSTDNYEKELNNSYSTATPISFNNKYSGYMNNSDDSDFYKVSLSSSATVTFDFYHTYVNNSRVYWNVYVYNYSGGAYNEVVYKTIYGKDSESYSLLNKANLSSGTYYVKVTTYYGDTTDHEYSIKLSSSSVLSSYTVTYNANGGTVSPSSKTVNAGEYVTLPTPTKKAAITYNANGGSNAPSAKTVSITCDGWSTSSTAATGTYDCGASYKPSKSITLYAVWVKTSTTLSSNEPTRSGYEFLGWSTSKTATSATYESGDKISLTKDTTLYAVWKEIPSGGDSGNSSGGDSVGNFTILSLILVPLELIADFFVMIFDFLFS
ncbi:MAG: InlB B-repeat-containing protein [Clostridia bacterium]|nr:InlB B-repeat-containing protein [Clostridia bacterium]